MHKYTLLIFIIIFLNAPFCEGNDTLLLKYNKWSEKYRINNPEKAVKFSLKALKEISESTPDTLKGITYKYLGLALYFNGALQEAIQSYEQALSFFEKAHSSGGIYDCLNNMAAAYKALGDYDKAFQYNEKALRINKAMDNPKNYANTYHNIGEIYHINYRYIPAIYYYLTAIRYEKAIQSPEGLSETYMNMGAVLEENGLYDHALIYYSEALSNFNKTGNIYRLGQCHNNLGVLYTRIGDYYAAKTHFQNSLVYKDSVHNTEGKITSLINLGNLSMIFNDTTKAKQYYQQAIQLQLAETHKEDFAYDLKRLSSETDDYFFFWISETVNEEDYGIVAQNLFNKGYINYVIGNRTDAIACFLNSLEIAEYNKMLFLVRDNCKYLSASYEELRDYKQALHYAKRLIGINDSIQAQSINDMLNISANIPHVLQKTSISEDNVKPSKNLNRKLFVSTGFLLILFLIVYFLVRKSSVRSNRSY
ncbi:MAG: photosystem I assembly protein Ycf3 [Bacteroidetes bacterium ADurb.Bin408]|nr:MAG: photosystem I assembly protein Ycf3 [Bacteroidetes bacterium ADurb.Bin408]